MCKSIAFPTIVHELAAHIHGKLVTALILQFAHPDLDQDPQGHHCRKGELLPHHLETNESKA